jgi:hypothetical protein
MDIDDFKEAVIVGLGIIGIMFLIFVIVMCCTPIGWITWGILLAKIVGLF